ncbi:MAG: acyl carrier protein [Acetobacteraceae bacterium]|nr:acyl carrier protein [Acetobacteraceae bacterium]MBV8524483.1 acyl carrier protein [Acetobacteraceae bacterium]
MPNVRIKQFVIEEFLPDVPEGDLTEDFDLIENGVIDSLGLLKVIAWIEDEFGVLIEVDEMVPENFSTIGTISAFVERTRELSGSDNLELA